MRPVARPPWNPSRAGLHAGDAVSAVFGEYCSACEIPLLAWRTGWNASTGEVVPGRARAADWDDLLVLCWHCARAAAGQAPGGSPLLPDRDATFAIGPGAPFRYEPRAVEVAGTDGGEPDVTERVFVVPNGAAAADTVRLFGLNTAQQGDEPPLTELDDPRLMLRTAAWEHARHAAVLYRRLTGTTARNGWAELLALAVSSRGFWSVWAAVLAGEVDDLPLLAAALGLPPGPAGQEAPGRRPAAVAVAVRDFPATRAVSLTPPSDTTEQG